MRYLHRTFLAGALGFAVSLIAACGGEAGLLSSNQAGALNSQLDRVSSALAAGNCSAVQAATQGLATALQNLPSTVNGTLKQDLANGASTVGELAIRQCHQAALPPTTPAAPTTSTPTAPTTSTPTTTPATTPTTAPTTTPTTAPATTPTTTGTNSSGGGGLSSGAGDGGGGQSAGGNGNGNGNGKGQ